MLGLTFQIGEHRLALDVRHITEVVPAVTLQEVVGGPPWLAGLCLYRGHVAPVIDLYRLLGAGECPRHLSTRIIFVRVPLDGEPRLLGLRASKVADIRELPTRGESEEANDSTDSSDRSNLGPVFVDRGEIIHLADLGGLLPESCRRAALRVSKELAAWT
ncbi:chemotaxis protein CheW [bacterium]|nr:chemotaxis protein CheW [bacterium]